MIKRSYSSHPDFSRIVQAYRDRYGVDLSHMRMKWSKHPVYNDGRRSYELDDDEAGGSWVRDGTVRINPKMGPVMKRFGIDGMTQAEFRRRLIAHELAHEVWHNQSRKAKVKRLIRDSLAKAREDNFTTPYLKTVPDQKMDEETFAEYMSDQLNKKAQAYDRKKWPDYEDYLKKHPDPKIELVERLVREHYAKQHPWGAKTESGRFLSHDQVKNRNIDDIVIRGGDNILRQRRGMCHELSNARLKMLRDHGIDARRLFAFYGVGQDTDGLLGHSFVMFKGDDGKYHFASPGMRDRPRKNFGRFDDLNDAVQQYIAAIKTRGDGSLTDDDYVEIHDTTDIDVPDKIKYKDFVRQALKKKLLYMQGK